MKRRPTRSPLSALSTLLLCALTLLSACDDETRDFSYSTEQIWEGEGEDTNVQEPITYELRGKNCADVLNGADANFPLSKGCYGLPRSGMNSIAELIALLPDSPPGNNTPDLFVSDETDMHTDQCRSDGPEILSGLPMVIEAVVTLHPRQYTKTTVCGQDERNYGTYLVEDDTGGIIVLRNSRVAPFSYGDRIKLTIHGMILTSRYNLDTRSVLIADVELIANVKDAEGKTLKTVLYQDKTTQDIRAFYAGDVGMVERVNGYVHVPPNNDNFGSMLITSELVDQNASEQPAQSTQEEQCRPVCVDRCLYSCGSAPSPEFQYSNVSAVEACQDMCATHCVGGAIPSNDDLLGCWIVGLDSELVRRGFAPGIGSHLEVSGPVVNSYDYQIWVMSLGQVQVLN